MIPRDEILSMAQKAGMTQLMGQTFHGHAMTPDVLERFAALVAAKVIARTPPPPLVVSMADAVRQLHGRDLCCCCAPAACHGDVLVAAAAWLSGPDVAECPAPPHPIPPSPANP